MPVVLVGPTQFQARGAHASRRLWSIIALPLPQEVRGAMSSSVASVQPCVCTQLRSLLRCVSASAGSHLSPCPARDLLGVRWVFSFLTPCPSSARLRRRCAPHCPSGRWTRFALDLQRPRSFKLRRLPGATGRSGVVARSPRTIGFLSSRHWLSEWPRGGYRSSGVAPFRPGCVSTQRPSDVLACSIFPGW